MKDLTKEILNNIRRAVTAEKLEGCPVVTWEDIVNNDIPVVPLPSSRINAALGCGGLPCGRVIEIFGPEAGGKAQPLDSKVLTPLGWQRMGDLQIGDLVCTPDGNIAPICGIYPQGQQEVVRVTFSDKTSVECCANHLWTVQNWDDKKRNVFITKSIKDLAQDYKSTNRLRYILPKMASAQFQEKQTLIDPYILGLLIGDGNLTNSTINFSSADQEIINAISNYCAIHNLKVNHKAAYDYAIVKKEKSHKRTSIRLMLESMGLADQKSDTKFIPYDYLYNSKQNRIALLQGLMDSDGYCRQDHNTGGLSFCTTSNQLVNDFCELVRSLGGKAVTGTKQTKYTYKGSRRNGLPAFNISVSLPQDIQPFRLTRKLNLYTYPINYDTSLRWIQDIEFTKQYKEMQCIYIDSPDHLYITNNYTPTHNTTLALHAIASAQEMGKTAAFVDMEHSLSPRYAAALGVDMSNLIVSQPDTGDDAMSLCKILVENGVDMIVLDSVAALVSKAELDKGICDANVGLQARMMSQGLRQLSPSVAKSGAILIFTNQVRDKISFMGGETTGGGRALKFYASVRLRIGRISAAKDTKDERQTSRVKIVKNKVGAPFRECEVDIVFGEGIDSITDTLQFAKEMKVIKTGGPYMTMPVVECEGLKDHDGNELKFRGLEAARGFVLETEGYLEALKLLTEKVYAKSRE